MSATVTNTIDIPAPPEVVWRVLTDFAAYAEPEKADLDALGDELEEAPTPTARPPPKPSSTASSSWSPASSSPPTSSETGSPATVTTRTPDKPLRGRRLAP
ncbi:MAG: SRPBCC family protein [Acidimicrobiales bacterium]